jgi:hypothetical protein
VSSAPAPEPTTVVVQQAAPPPTQVIVIEPAQPSVVYVPAYNPTVVYGPWWYPAYPPYYYPPPPGYWFSRTIATGIARGVGIGISNALWGGFDWGRRDVDINVNRRIDVDARRTSWSHDSSHRGKTPYRGGDATRQKLDKKREAGNREQFRGKEGTRDAARDGARDASRDASRDRAADAMKERGGSGATSWPRSRSRWPTPMRRRSTRRATGTATACASTRCAGCPRAASATASTGRRCPASHRARWGPVSRTHGPGSRTTGTPTASSPRRGATPRVARAVA